MQRTVCSSRAPASTRARSSELRGQQLGVKSRSKSKGFRWTWQRSQETRTKESRLELVVERVHEKQLLVIVARYRSWGTGEGNRDGGDHSEGRRLCTSHTVSSFGDDE